MVTVGAFVVVLAVTPLVAALIIPLACVYARVQQRYIATSRELKRLDSLNFSPIFSHLAETLQVTRSWLAEPQLLSVAPQCQTSPAPMSGITSEDATDASHGSSKGFGCINAGHSMLLFCVLQGLATIRAFRQQPQFLAVSRALVDASTRAWWPIMTCNRWLQIRLEFIGIAIMTAISLSVAVLRWPHDPGVWPPNPPSPSVADIAE